MIGPCPDAKGGMASVIAVYRANGLFASGNCLYLTTAVEGSGINKLLAASLAMMRFSVLMLRGHVALLHVHGASHSSFWRKYVFMRLARLFAVPVIFHLHGGEFRQFVDVRINPRARHRVVETLGACKLILCLNEEVRAWLHALVPHVTVQVMANPIELRAHAQSTEKREQRVLYLGRLEREKGVFDLLEAFANVAHHMPDSHLTLCGAGSAKDGLEKWVQQEGISRQVTFPGWVEGDAKDALLSQAGVFVLPSYAEGMPMAVLECMAAQTPVVATRVGAIADMLETGASGFVVKPGDIHALGDAILRALTDREMVDAMTQRALVRVHERYAANVVVSQLRQIHRELSV